MNWICARSVLAVTWTDVSRLLLGTNHNLKTRLSKCHHLTLPPYLVDHMTILSPDYQVTWSYICDMDICSQITAWYPPPTQDQTFRMFCFYPCLFISGSSWVKGYDWSYICDMGRCKQIIGWQPPQPQDQTFKMSSLQGLVAKNHLVIETSKEWPLAHFVKWTDLYFTTSEFQRSLLSSLSSLLGVRSFLKPWNRC